MVRNGQKLLASAPIDGMCNTKNRAYGVSWGLSEAGYDIRIAETITYHPPNPFQLHALLGQKPWDEVSIKKAAHGWVDLHTPNYDFVYGNFVLVSSKEKFQLPNNLVGIVHDKSTWIRKGVAVHNTVAEPNWAGYLTLELSFHSVTEPITIQAGSGIAQIIFHVLEEEAYYDGKYQNQGKGATPAIFE